MKDEVIDLTGVSEHNPAPPIVTPNNSYNSYSLSMTFWENNEEENAVSNSNEDLNALRITPTNTHSRTMRLVLIYLRGEQDKFRGITEARGDHWRNSWSAAIRSITNYWHVYGKDPNWWGRVDSYLFGRPLGKESGSSLKKLGRWKKSMLLVQMLRMQQLSTC